MKNACFDHSGCLMLNVERKSCCSDNCNQAQEIYNFENHALQIHSVNIKDTEETTKNTESNLMRRLLNFGNDVKVLYGN